MTDPTHFEKPLTLVPDLIPDPDRRRERENMRRIEEYVRQKIAADTKRNQSYYRRFLFTD